jgi:hypothetical protein
VTVVTPLACEFRPPPFDPYLAVTSYIPRSCTCVQQRTEGTKMFYLIVFGAVLVALVAATGLPYPQTWHGRFGD